MQRAMWADCNDSDFLLPTTYYLKIFMKEWKKSLVLGFIFAAGVLVYVGLVALFMTGLTANFDGVPQATGVLFMLLLLCFSAATVGTLIFGRPVYLLLDKRLKQAATQLLLILGWLLVFFVVIFLTVIL